MLMRPFGFIPFRKKKNKSHPSYASYLGFTNKKMEEICVCMCVFMNSAYKSFLTAVIQTPVEEPAEQDKTSSCLFL